MDPSDIENRLTKEQRLRDGIFFTPQETVQAILDRFSGTGIKNIIDSAAGSGNFLIKAALKWPSARIWGIEKNPDIYRMTAPHLSGYRNITYLKGDCLVDRFDIPPCDLYLGNPPFINHTDLSPSYRKEILPFWKESGLTGTGYGLLLGNSRADIAALIFHETVKRYVKQGGSFAVVLPLSLLSAGGANRGFQSFNGITAEHLENLEASARFRDALHPAFCLSGRKGGLTRFPIPASGFEYQGWEPPPRRETGYYRARQGINTLGANPVYLFRGNPPFESSLLRPLYTGKDPGLWTGTPTGRVLLPYHDDGSLIPEKELSEEFPNAYRWLLQNRSLLESRRSSHVKGAWYALFGVGPYTFTPWKVIWRSMGQKRILASVSNRGIANQALQGYIPVSNPEEADYLSGILNSDYCHSIIMETARPGSLSFGQPGSVARLPVPRYDPENPLMKSLADTASGCRKESRAAIPQEINVLSGEILSGDLGHREV